MAAIIYKRALKDYNEGDNFYDVAKNAMYEEIKNTDIGNSGLEPSLHLGPERFQLLNDLLAEVLDGILRDSLNLRLKQRTDTGFNGSALF